MIVRLLLALAMVSCTPVLAQEPVYRWGPPATNDFPERRIERLLALGDQGFVLLRASEDATTVKHYWLERYSSTLEFKGSTEVPFNVGVMGDAQFLDEVTVVNGTIYAFVSHWNKAARQTCPAGEGAGAGRQAHRYRRTGHDHRPRRWATGGITGGPFRTMGPS